MKVLIPQTVDGAGIKYLEEHGIEVIKGSAHDVATLKKEIVDCDGLLARTELIPAEVIDAAPKLKVISRHGVGYNNIDLVEAKKKGIIVTNAPLSNFQAVAEHSMAFILACAIKLKIQDHAVVLGNWDKSRSTQHMDELGEKVLGIVGLGRIGRTLAKIAINGFSMKIIAFDPFVKSEDAPKGVTMVEHVEEIFISSDFVSLHLPAGVHTNGMINYALLSQMKPTAYLINCARGEILNFDDFRRIMKEGKISGAALDVMETEPPENLDDELFTMDNIIFSPHCGAHSREAFMKMSLHSAMGIVDVLEGRKPEWQVRM